MFRQAAQGKQCEKKRKMHDTGEKKREGAEDCVSVKMGKISFPTQFQPSSYTSKYSNCVKAKWDHDYNINFHGKMASELLKFAVKIKCTNGVSRLP